MGGLGPDLLFPLDVAGILCLALEDDVAPGEVVGRILATHPKDAGVLASVGDRYLKRHMDAAQRNAGLTGFGVKQAAQKLDEFVAREIFDLVGMNGEHPPS